ncbi:MAG: dockerin type I domain-containing protein [Candidatus Bathyarchaeales archaeon]
MKIAKNQLKLVFLIILIISVLPKTAKSESATVVSTDPQRIQINTTSTFNVNITVYNVTDLSAWQIKMTFNPYIIQCTNISLPQPDIFWGHYTTGLSYKIDNQQGYIIAFNGLWEPTGVNGSGTLCQLTLQAIDVGISSLAFTGIMQISGTYLVDSKDNLITMETTDGLITVAPENFNQYQFTVQVGTKTYNVSVLTNSSLTNFNFNSTSKIMGFSLNGPDGTYGACSTSIPKELLNGTFAITVNNQATAFSSSNDKSNNYLCFTYHHSLINVQILTTIFGDISGDRTVDGKDIAIASRAFGSYLGSARWNPIADVNKDLQVDGIDLALISKEFGKTWSA